MAKLAKSFVAHERMPKRPLKAIVNEQKQSSMNKSRKRSFKIYNSQGK